MDRQSSLYCVEQIVGSPWSDGPELCPSERFKKEISSHDSSCLIICDIPAQNDATLISLFEKEHSHMPEGGYLVAMKSDNLCAVRLKAVLWILKVCNVYCFSPITAALAVNYFDRYFSKNLSRIRKGWMIQLVSVACLSLAAKMEEIDVPFLLELQIEGSEHVFEARTIQRMELAILGALAWRMSSVTAISFVHDLLDKLDRSRNFRRMLSIRVMELLLGALTDLDFIEFRPSVVAASAIFCALQEIAPMDAESHKHALSQLFPKEKVNLSHCYNLLEERVVDPIYPLVFSSFKTEIPQSPVTVSEVSAEEFSIRLKHALNWSCLRRISVTGHFISSNSVSSTPRKRKLDEFLK
ncbi:hypothetical protein O6H91_16G095400 [Diphasiastrum complanatum]|uniref:Uncharacterized protein n=1 Tax=Diphasiastrum complanatum TaxID=34168 RepID=A0ACC2BF64_DIPCM|nr:hypothetical protein O6H91_16G095400 [Diphasiastrum complanatum]